MTKTTTTILKDDVNVTRVTITQSSLTLVRGFCLDLSNRLRRKRKYRIQLVSRSGGLQIFLVGKRGSSNSERSGEQPWYNKETKVRTELVVSLCPARGFRV